MAGGVWAELQAEAAPLTVKTLLADAPDWLEVRSSPVSLTYDPDLDALDAGEREAIQLASELGADLPPMDDREGRSFAMRRQLPVTGTLGVLEKADVIGILSDLPASIARESGIPHPGRQIEAAGFQPSQR